MTGKKLPHYFECHSIIVVASNPVSSILNNPDATGRMSLWRITLGPWEITYHRQSVIKSQVLLDFIAEWTEAQMPELPDMSNCWTIYVDGSKRVSGAGAGVVLVSPQGDKMRYVLRMRFSNPSNNEAEYEAVLHGMRMAKACGATRIKIHGVSNLIAQQVMKECDVTYANMIAYRAMYDKLEGDFEGCEVTHISRETNEEADSLANVGSRCLPIPSGVFLEEIFECSIKIKPAVDPALATRSGAKQTSSTPAAGTEDSFKDAATIMLIEVVWTKPYLAYLVRGELPEDPIHHRQVMRCSKAFTIINGELYKRSTIGVLQRCIAQEDGIALLREIHEGTCGHHSSSRTLVAKAFRSGFYCLSALYDARNIVQQCKACQLFTTKPHAPASELHTIPIAWPFTQWGLD
jgi:ribonuclease HI